MKITTHANRYSQPKRSLEQNAEYQEHLNTVQDIAEIQSTANGEQFRGFIELGLKREHFAMEALSLAKKSEDATRGQRFAIRLLETMVKEQPDESKSSAMIRGGLVALRQASDNAVTLADVGKAAGELLLGSVRQPPHTRDAYLEGGLKTLYSRTRMDASMDLRASLPSEDTANNPAFLASLLIKNPHWKEYLPTLSQLTLENPSSTSLTELAKILESNGVKNPPRLSALQTPRGELLNLVSREYKDRVRHFDLEGASRILDLEKNLSRTDGSTLVEILEKVKQAASYETDIPSLNEADEQEYLKNKRTHFALSAAMIGGTAVFMAILSGPAMLVFGGLFGALPALALQDPNYSKAYRVRESARKIQASEAFLIDLCESVPKEHDASHTKVSRKSLLQSAAERVSAARTSLELQEHQSILALLGQTPGEDAFEVFEAIHRIESKEGDTVRRKALELVKDIVLKTA